MSGTVEVNVPKRSADAAAHAVANAMQALMDRQRTEYMLKKIRKHASAIGRMGAHAVSKWGSCHRFRTKVLCEGVQCHWESYTNDHPENVSYDEYRKIILSDKCFSKTFVYPTVGVER